MGTFPDLELSISAAPTPSEVAPGEFETLYDEDGRVWASISIDGDKRLIQVADVGTFSFQRPGTVVATIHPGMSEADVRYTFDRYILPLVLYFDGYEVLHASAVATAHGVVGFCAQEDIGKTTTAYGLSRRGFSLWADDALALELEIDRVRAIRLKFEPNLDASAATLFGPGTPMTTSPSCLTAPLAAVVVLDRVSKARSCQAAEVSRLRRGESFDAVVQHAYRLNLGADEHRRRRLIKNYMRLVDAVPVFKVLFRPGLKHLPAVLDEIEARLTMELKLER